MGIQVFNVPTPVIHELNQAAAKADSVDKSELTPMPADTPLNGVKYQHEAIWHPRLGQVGTRFAEIGDTMFFVAKAPAPVAQHRPINGVLPSIWVYDPFFRMPKFHRLEVLLHEWIHTLDNPAKPHGLAQVEEFNAYVGAVLNIIHYTADSPFEAAKFVVEWYKMVEGQQRSVPAVAFYPHNQSWNWAGMLDCVQAGGFQQKLAVLLRNYLNEYNATRSTPRFTLG